MRRVPSPVAGLAGPPSRALARTLAAGLVLTPGLLLAQTGAEASGTPLSALPVSAHPSAAHAPAAAARAAEAAADTPDMDTDALAAQVLALTNALRAQPRHCGGVRYEAAPALKLNPVLNRVAADHALDMARRGVLAHVAPDRSSHAQRLRRAGYPSGGSAENIARWFRTPAEVVAAWYQSPGHCAAIMTARYTEMGAAVRIDPDSRSVPYWVQVFGSR